MNNRCLTTGRSGHLARHNRIHTGEKNFPCLFPGCQSRFSRQDNMMQHYRTHMAPKSRRAHKPSTSAVMKEEVPSKPRLHAHHRIRSDPYRVEAPLTISQHLANYHHRPLSKDTLFFQHRPIHPTPAGQASSFMSTLLHPTPPTDRSKACESPT
ncbi:hypothetical protein CLU79DRAFT_696231 [Phycomyces nitens]|nr:hypothetical protein CLU79DRAFT_696231 [Phycomyces nitens]